MFFVLIPSNERLLPLPVFFAAIFSYFIRIYFTTNKYFLTANVNKRTSKNGTFLLTFFFRREMDSKSEKKEAYLFLHN